MDLPRTVTPGTFGNVFNSWPPKHQLPNMCHFLLYPPRSCRPTTTDRSWCCAAPPRWATCTCRARKHRYGAPGRNRFQSEVSLVGAEANISSCEAYAMRLTDVHLIRSPAMETIPVPIKTLSLLCMSNISWLCRDEK